MLARAAVVVLLMIANALGRPPSAAARTLSVPDAFTPVLVGFVGDETMPVQGTDGRWHVVYELWLTNARPVPATIERIEVLDYDRRERVLAVVEGDALSGALKSLATRPDAGATLAPDTSKLLFLELAFDSPGDVPDAIVHRLSGRGGASPAANEPVPMSYLVAPWDLTERPVPVLGAPLSGGGWVAINGCCSARGAHRGAVMPVDGRLRDAQRFAIDWMKIGADGRFVAGDPGKVESFVGYDEPVLAVAGGEVVEVTDGLDDQVPGDLPDPATISIENIDGNHVILDIGGANYVFYAHLKKGTVRVKKGDRVAAGQEIGRLGNSGNTSGPHLHLHVVTGPSALAADGIPYVFSSFVLAGMLDPEAWDAADSVLDTTYRVFPGDGSGPRRDELPLDLRIVDFPEVRHPAAAASGGSEDEAER